MQNTKHDYKNYWQLRQAGGWWKENQSIIQVKGPEAATYLQTQITQDVKALEVHQGAYSALVNRKGQIQSLFLIFRTEAEKYLLIPENQSNILHEHLEKFHFVEDLEITRDSLTGIHIEGPQLDQLYKQLSGRRYSDFKPLTYQTMAVPGGSSKVFSINESGETGIYVLLEDSARFETLLTQQFQWPEIDPRNLELIRTEQGYLKWDREINSETKLPATGQEAIRVSYDKGCYLGQEVIARIKTYGVVAYKLMGLISSQPLPMEAFSIEGKKAGNITTSTWSPQLESFISLGYVHKNYRENGQTYTLEFAEQSECAEISRLPLYQPPSLEEKARELYEQALTAFAEDEEQLAIDRLKSAIEKDPKLADAYESLGVILSRNGAHKEAIEVMKELLVINPKAGMAHTNLSRFYMLLGDKITAEEHMAEATRLDMEAKAAEYKAQNLLTQQKQQKESMLELFREVLETEDSEDLVANFGLGKGLVDLERHAEALPYLEKAVDLDPYYSAAYLQWGKALTATKDFEQAKAVYKKGIEAAAEKGDLMPMKEMEQYLLKLSS